VYLITGGLGYLGRLTAKALMGHGARRVVLVSSRSAEVPADWDGPFAPVVERCDVGDTEEVAALVGRWAGLKGVIHAAGVRGSLMMFGTPTSNGVQQANN